MESVKFKKPPLIEVVFGMEIELPELSLVHVGLYWQTIKDKFPTPVETFGELALTDEDSCVSNFPAVWYLSSEKNRLIRLTQDYFSYHWRTVGKDYLHFDKLFDEYLKQWHNLQSWWQSISTESIKIKGYNLQYINLIDENSGWKKPEDNRKVFCFSDGTIKTSLSLPKFYSSKLGFDLPDELGNLIVSLEPHKLEKSDNEIKDIIIFDLSASGIATEEYSKEDWFISSHNAIIKLFLELTTAEAQSLWGRIDG